MDLLTSTYLAGFFSTFFNNDRQFFKGLNGYVRIELMAIIWKLKSKVKCRLREQNLKPLLLRLLLHAHVGHNMYIEELHIAQLCCYLHFCLETVLHHTAPPLKN